MDKFLVETYREHQIWYNADTDKFTVELLIEDNWRKKGRKSLKDCRKAIDEHIKANVEFEPFMCLHKQSYSDGSIVKLLQVRKDGGLLLEKNGKTQTEITQPLEQLKGKTNYFFFYNPDYVEWLDKKEQMDKRHQQEAAEMQKLKPELTPLDLSFIKDITG
jgi:hypothetical protein